MGKFLVWMLVAGLAGLLLWVDDALVWILGTGLLVWFVLIPALALWIAIHALGQEEGNDGNAYDVSDSHGG
jgi:hypothetical protein